MHRLVVLAVAALRVNAASHVGTDLACDEPSTLYVTVPAAALTETVYVIGPGMSSKLAAEQPLALATKMVVHAEPATQVKANPEATPAPKSKDQNSYSFIDDAGKTEWLGGKTPSASTTFDIVTSYVTLEPLPDVLTVTNEISTTTSIFSSHDKYTGRKVGWNATSFTTTAGSSGIVQPAAATNSHDKHVSLKYNVNHRFYPSRATRGRLVAKDIGVVVVAAIDGAAVSWTNNFDTAPSTIKATDNLIPISTNTVSDEVRPLSLLHDYSGASLVSPLTTEAIYPWDLNLSHGPTSSSTITQIASTAIPSSTGSAMSGFSNSSSTNSSTTVGIYPWDLGPKPNTSSVSSSSAVISLNPFMSNTDIPRPSLCGSASSYWTVTFDDLPRFDMSSEPNNTNTIPPIFNPYRKLYWAGQFGYVPPPSDPYPPKSPPQLAVYRADSNYDITSSPDAGLEHAGGIGAGPRTSNSAYWFDAQSVWFGCSDGSNNTCQVTINGYTANNNNDDSDIRASQNVDIPPCPGFRDCSLSQVYFAHDMVGLASLQILARIGGEAVDYYMDDLVLRWYNGTCAAQLERASAE